MVEGTALEVVILWILLTLVYLESEEVEEHDALSHADLPRVIPAAMHALIRLVVALVVVFVAPCKLLLLCKLFLNGYLLLELLLSVLRDPCRLIRLLILRGIKAGLRARIRAGMV